MATTNTTRTGRPRRARCGSCLAMHVLLAVSCLLRRADGVDVIGAALRAKAAGVGHRRIAARLDRPASTVRGWLRTFVRNAEWVRSIVTALLVQMDPLTGPLPAHPGVFADAVESVGVCAAAARRGGSGDRGRLLDELDRWAARHAIHRLELTVMADNARAIRLYEAKGYVREGVRRGCLAVDGVLVDEWYMGTLL